jgi:hypothetical protein
VAIELGREGAQHLADALRVDRSVSSIDLSRNGITPEDSVHFVEALVESGNWSLLSVHGAGREIHEFCARNSENKARTLSLLHALLDDEGETRG